jgi:hypothetical protein
LIAIKQRPASIPTGEKTRLSLEKKRETPILKNYFVIFSVHD